MYFAVWARARARVRATYRGSYSFARVGIWVEVGCGGRGREWEWLLLPQPFLILATPPILLLPHRIITNHTCKRCDKALSWTL